MIRNRRSSSFIQVELLLAAAFLTMMTSAASPVQAPSRIASNEASAIEVLRAVARAQTRFKAPANIDTNCDGLGEYGFFAELAGTLPMRVAIPVGGDPPCVPGAGWHPDDILRRIVLRSSFGRVTHSCATYQGYLFMMWLPGASDGIGRISGVAEDQTGGKMAAPFPGAVNGAHLWCCYAWPIEYGRTGRRAFFMNERGVVLEYTNRSATPFSGPAFVAGNHTPSFDEAYSAPNDMGSPLRIGIPNATGSVWWPVQ